MEAAALLQLVHGRLAAQRDTRALYAERLAPEFTVFQFIDTRETGLSRVLAWLLDPQGSHAQGPRFLLAFMHWLELDESWIELGRCARVSTEVPTQFGKRVGYIDILAVCAGRALAIENKPNAIDQELQIARYLEDMSERWPDGQAILYLSGSGDPPAEESISEKERRREQADGRLIVRGYGELIHWIDACRAACRAPSVQLMLEGFQSFVEREFMGIKDSEQAAGLARTIAASDEMLASALALFEAQQPLYELLIQRLIEEVTVKARARKWVVNRADLGDRNYSMLVIGFAADSPVNFGISFDMSNYRYLYYGMISEESRKVPKALATAVREVVGRGGSTAWWPVYRTVGPNDRFFPLARDANHEFWSMIRRGELADRLIDFVAAIEKHLRSKRLLGVARYG